MKDHSLSEVAAVISGLKSVVIISHFNPDPDAYSSSCALGLVLAQSGAKVSVVNQNGPDSRYLVIPGVKSIVKAVPSGNWNAVITCDCAELERVGDQLIEAIEKAGLNRAKIRDELASMKTYLGVTGKKKFDATYNNVSPAFLAILNKGRWSFRTNLRAEVLE